jgi:hypothetical protein
MSTLITWGRILFAALALTALMPCARALGQSSETQTPTTNPPAGDPAFGVLIIVGIIGLLVVVAWIFSRTGDDGGRGPDRTLL